MSSRKIYEEGAKFIDDAFLYSGNISGETPNHQLYHQLFFVLRTECLFHFQWYLHANVIYQGLFFKSTLASLKNDSSQLGAF